MRIRSPVRRHSWSKHTSYPTAGSDGKIPGECASLARASKKSSEQDLEAQQSVLNTMKRKSLSFMDKQRKELEKSMLAYSTKMKQITNSRVNDLFRDIHTRNAMREENESERAPRIRHDLESLSDSHSSPSPTSTRSLPARPDRGVYARRHSELRTLKGFKQIDVRTPILESRENSTPELRHLLLPRSGSSRNTNSSSLRRTSDLLRMFQGEQKATGDTERLPYRPAMTRAKLARHSVPNITVNDQTLDCPRRKGLNTYRHSVDITVPNTDRQVLDTCSIKKDDCVSPDTEAVIDRVQFDNSESPPDSAYSSTTDDSGLASIGSTDSDQHPDQHQQTGIDVQLAVPKLRTRRRRKRQPRYSDENLVKQSVLKRAQSLFAEKRRSDLHRSIL